MSVATDVKTFIIETMMARKGYLRSDAAFLQANEGLRNLKG